MSEYLSKNKKTLWIFFLCSIIVFFIHFTLYQPVIQYKLFNVTEDWPFLILYKSLYPNPLARIVDVWTNIGLHTSAQIYHIGILSEFLKLNYQSYQVVNVILKALGTLSFFPLIMVLFKNKKLAFTATILFATSSATAGSFLWVVKGSEYIGILLMNIFLITYYLTIKKNSKKLLSLSALIMLISYLCAPPRMFPLPILVVLVELYWLISMRKISNLKYSIIRAAVLILPIILISKPAPVSGMPFTSRPAWLMRDILNGNWQNLFDPFAGIGWTLFTNDIWRFFGDLNMETFINFNDFFFYLLKGSMWIFWALTLILSLILSKKWQKFFILVIVLNFIAEVLFFFVIRHHFTIPPDLVAKYAFGQFLLIKYPTIVAIYMFIIAFVCYLEWKKEKGNNLLRAIWVGPVFSVIFLWPTWVVMGPLINDYTSAHWYFGIPAMGTTLALAAILVLLYDKFKHRKLLRGLVVIIILCIGIVFYQTHGMAIAKQYRNVNPEMISLKDQGLLHDKLIKKLGSSAVSGDLLIYLDINSDSINLRRTVQYYKEALVVTKFGFWVHFRRVGDGSVNNGCIEVILDKETLKSALVKEGDKVGFKYKGICVDKSIQLTSKGSAFYQLDRFYAFRIKNGEFVDIRDEVLKGLF